MVLWQALAIIGELGELGKVTAVEIVLGLLWSVEIGINNIIAPPLPQRDYIDHFFWAVIALSLFIFAVVRVYQTGSIGQGIKVGVWSGFVSGLLACGTALSLIVFGMRFITHDPLNVAEWAANGVHFTHRSDEVQGFLE